jgi:hypothetical protein
MNSQETTPRLLLIVREQLRPGTEGDYADNELQIAAACGKFECPHPYLALASLAEPREVWWLNAFASSEEKDRVGAAYARNESLMAALRPLGARKEAFRQALTTTLTAHRPDVSTSSWRIGGARFFVVNLAGVGEAAGSVFESPDGDRFDIASAESRVAAERLAARAPGSMLLAVEPQWSYPDASWVAADPEFWALRFAPSGSRHAS